jgi:hypothetical protein
LGEIENKNMRSLFLLPARDWVDILPFTNNQLRHSALITHADGKMVNMIKRQGYEFGVLQPVASYENTEVVGALVQKIYQQMPFSHIVAPDEIDILRAAYMRQQFHLAGQGIESALAFQDKLIMKQFVEKKGLRVPHFQAVKSLAEINAFTDRVGYPIILKPVRGTGCEGLIVLSNQTELEAFAKQGKLDDLNDYMAESFVPGAMYHTDGLVENGKLVCCWPSIYLDLPLNIISGGYASSYILAADNPLVSKLIQYTQEVLQALPTPSDTAFHLECFLPDENEDPVFCEIASRVGGKGVNDALLTSFEINLKRNFMLMQAGLPCPTIEMPSKPNVLTGEVWFPKQKGRLKYIETTCPFPWVKKYEVYAQVGEQLNPVGTLNDLLAGSPLIISETETQMQQCVAEFAKWFQSTIVFS